VFCCAKPYTGEEEDDEMESVIYDEGESGDDENRLGRAFLKMKEKEKLKRVRSLWYMMLAKAKGAVLVLDRFSTLTRRIYLFGTSKKLKFEIEKEQKIRWYIILPEGRVRVFWNSVVMLLLLYTSIFVPFQTAFVDSDNEFYQDLDVFFDCMFILDFVLNFFMAYEDKDKKVEIRLKFIARNYLYTWLLLDLLSCIPF
jgi:hypothetical protein